MANAQVNRRSILANRVLKTYNHYLSLRAQTNNLAKVLQSKQLSKLLTLGRKGAPRWRTLLRAKLKKMNSGKKIMSILEVIWEEKIKTNMNLSIRPAVPAETNSIATLISQILIRAKGAERKGKKLKRGLKETGKGNLEEGQESRRRKSKEMKAQTT